MEGGIPIVVPAECMTYLTPEDSIRRWTSAIWAETEGDAVPIWLYLVRLVALGIFFFFFYPEGIGVVERQTGMRQKSATQWVGVGMEVILVDRRSLDRGGL